MFSFLRLFIRNTEHQVKEPDERQGRLKADQHLTLIPAPVPIIPTGAHYMQLPEVIIKAPLDPLEERHVVRASHLPKHLEVGQKTNYSTCDDRHKRRPMRSKIKLIPLFGRSHQHSKCTETNPKPAKSTEPQVDHWHRSGVETAHREKHYFPILIQALPLTIYCPLAVSEHNFSRMTAPKRQFIIPQFSHVVNTAKQKSALLKQYLQYGIVPIQSHEHHLHSQSTARH